MKPAPGHSPSFRGAMMYMQGSFTLSECAERYAVSITSVFKALSRYREAQLNIWPEDEVSP